MSDSYSDDNSIVDIIDNPIAKQKLDTIIELSKELVLEHKIPQVLIYNEITKDLIKNINEKEYILYSACHGGFSFSDQFHNFCKKDIYSKRSNMKTDIISFGKHLGEKYPLLLKMVNTYYINNLKYQVNKSYTYKNLLDSLNKLKKNIEKLSVMDKSLKIKGKLDFVCYMYNDFNDIISPNGKYTIQDLIDFYNNDIDKKSKEITELEKELNNNVYTHLDYVFPDENTFKFKKYSFLDAIDHYGLEHFAIWKCQHKINEKVMRYLLATRDFSDNDILEKTYETLGLIGASGKYANLDFAEIPAGLSWSISEYDGLEKIIID